MFPWASASDTLTKADTNFVSWDLVLYIKSQYEISIAIFTVVVRNSTKVMRTHPISHQSIQLQCDALAHRIHVLYNT